MRRGKTDTTEPVSLDAGRLIKPVVLAAGASRRLGTAKQLVSWRGKALIAHAVDAVLGAHPALAAPAVVVAPPQRQAVREALAARPVLLIDNPASHTGMASSLRIAVAAARDAHADALLVSLSDQPLVAAASLRRLLEAWGGEPTRAVASAFGEVDGAAPAILPGNMFADLAALEGDAGARRVLRAAPGRLAPQLIDMPEAHLDIDRPEDLRRLSAELD